MEHDDGRDSEDRISLTALARLASSAAPPPPLEYEEVLPTPAAPSVPPEGRGRSVLIGIGVGSLVGAVVAAAVVLFALGQDREVGVSVAADVEEPAAPEPASPEPTAIATGATAVAQAQASASAFVERAVATPEPVEEIAAVTLDVPAEREERAERAQMRDEHQEDQAVEVARVAEPEAESDPDAATPPAAAEPSRETPSSPEPAEHPTTLAGLMEAAAAVPEPSPAPEQDEPSRLTPTRAEVTAAFEGLRGAILQCAEGEHGMVDLEITVGSSGRVRSALVTGHFSGSAKGSCMARAARRLSFSPFEEATFSARYPFRI